jgi:hypothetical protein
MVNREVFAQRHNPAKVFDDMIDQQRPRVNRSAGRGNSPRWPEDARPKLNTKIRVKQPAVLHRREVRLRYIGQRVEREIVGPRAAVTLCGNLRVRKRLHEV